MPHIQATGFYMVHYDYSRAWIVTARGDGSGVARLTIKVASGCTLLLDGTARFYSDAAGTLNESDTWTPTSGSLQTRYVRCPSGTANLVFNDPDLLLGFGHAISWASGHPSWHYDTTNPSTLPNIPSLTIDNWNHPNCVDIYLSTYATILIANIAISQLSPSLLYFTSFTGGTVTGTISDIPLTTQIFSLNQTNVFSGNITDIPASVTDFRVGGSNVVTGDITNLKEGLLQFFVTGSNTISGDTSNLPSTLTYIYLYGNNTISGDIADIPVALTSLDIGGNNTIYGDIADIPSDITRFNIAGNNTIEGDLDYFPAGSVISYINIGGANTITGGFTALPSTLGTLNVMGDNTINGLIEDIPINVTVVGIQGVNAIGGTLNNLPVGSAFSSLLIIGNNTITGDIVNLPATLLTLSLTGGNTVYGDLNDLPANIRYTQILGDNAIIDYSPPSGGRTWYSLANSGTAFNFQPGPAGGLSSAEVDELIIDLDASTTTSRSSAASIYITGSNEPRTSASDAAVASLLSHNITVVTN